MALKTKGHSKVTSVFHNDLSTEKTKLVFNNKTTQ